MARKTSDVKLLGAKAEIPASPDKAILDRVANPHPDTPYVARFTAPEFTALCPVTGQPDFALLMIEAARSLGLAARFASGYLAVPLDDPEEPTSGPARGSTHAWAQIYLPGIGWIDFDPTTGSVGKIDLVTVAVVRDPHDAIPLHGTFIGFPSDHLGMEVQVSATPGTPDAIWTTPQRSTRTQFAQRA